jgi:hypothetical protein
MRRIEVEPRSPGCTFIYEESVRGLPLSESVVARSRLQSQLTAQCRLRVMHSFHGMKAEQISIKFPEKRLVVEEVVCDLKLRPH